MFLHGSPKFCADMGKILVKGGATILADIEAEAPEVWTAGIYGGGRAGCGHEVWTAGCMWAGGAGCGPHLSPCGRCNRVTFYGPQAILYNSPSNLMYI